ncbi:hypothetical protein LC653_42720 [Nostoc sp. CHAB 5784]|uniref:hypothetical protein n=1 Tax=Nostoc mirabile TaxID=2907820 RepID=UPI001E5D9C76|nr:hypothetical protein [Nostoc mirabile]MCC5670324.1 hypothetical protein [Nostoc mirabile CHAB5784]
MPQSINVVRAASNEPAIAPYWAIVDKTLGVNPSPVKVTNNRIIMPCDRKLKSSGGDGECWEQYLSVL